MIASRLLLFFSFVAVLPVSAFAQNQPPQALALAPGPEGEPIVRAVQGALPAVVNIYTEYTEEVRDPYDAYFDVFGGGGMYRGNRILRKPVRSLGSGALVSEDGYIVTNEHVANRAKDLKIKVTLPDKTDFEAKLIRSNPDIDLALIKIDSPRKFPFLSLAKLSPNMLGQTVIAIGNPVGYESSVSSGILSAKDRTLAFEETRLDGLLQTDAAINPGNSGGPLIDIAGQFVGLNTAKMNFAGAPGQAFQVENIGFAIPGARVKEFVEEAIQIAQGKIPPPPTVSLTKVLQEKLGLQVQEVTGDLAREFQVRPGNGLVVTGVDKDSPADAAGIERGMMLITLGSKRLASEADLPRMLTKLAKGQQVALTLLIQQRRGMYLLQRPASVILTAK